MSWSEINFDIFTPKVYGTMTTTNMIYNDIVSHTEIKYCPIQGSCESETCDIKNCISSPSFTGCTNNLNIVYYFDTNACETPSGIPTCAISRAYNCGTFQSQQTCTLGTNGVGDCLNGTCIEAIPNNPTGANWSSLSIPNSTTSGWVICEYNYDFSKLSYETYQEYANWLNAIWTGQGNSSAPNGMDPSSRPRIRDTNFAYACVSDFYNQIYNTGFYSSNPASNNFSNYDFLSNSIQKYIQNITVNLGNMVFGTTPIPTNLQNAITSACVLPSIIQNGDQYNIVMNLSYSQMLEAKAGNLNSYIQNCLNTLLKDASGVMLQNGENVNISLPTFINTYLTTYSAIQLIDGNGNASYGLVSNIEPGSYNSAYYNGFIFAYCQVSSVIQSWSPMLVMYAVLTNPSLTFSQTACSTISTQIHTIPLKCYETCGTNCLQNIDNYCTISYTPPNNINPVLAQQTLFLDSSDQCHCYNSFLVPAGQTPSIGNFASMCFANSCDSKMKQMFGLTDQDCAQYCQEVGNWAENNDMREPSDFNIPDFNRICGYIPQAQPLSYNSSVLSTGIVMTILMSMLTFSICKHKNYGTFKTTLFVFIVFAIFSALTGFFTRDLAGTGFCSSINTNDFKYKFVCQSRLSKINLPSYFCNYQEACECVSNSDCPTGCNICASTFCIPESGSRQTQVVSKSRPNVIMIIFSVISCVILPIVLIYLHDDNHWILSKKTFSVIAIVIGIIGLIFTIVQATKKYSQTEVVGSCKVIPNVCNPPCDENQTCNNQGICVCSTNPCVLGNQCGTDGCGNSCGTCATGYTCNETTRTCVGVVSFNIGYADSKNNQYILTTSNVYPPANLSLIPISDYEINPSAYLSQWIYDPVKQMIYLEPSPSTNNEIYALTTGGKSKTNFCDPYPTKGGVGYVTANGQFFGDYMMYIDLYNQQTIDLYGSQRFERWKIFSNGIIADMQCNSNTSVGRYISVYINPNGSAIMTTSAPWNLKPSQFNFNPISGIFSTDTPPSSLLVCQVRTGEGYQNPCPMISSDILINPTGFYTQIPLCNTSTLKPIASPHPLWQTDVIGVVGDSVCGISPVNRDFQEGCSAFLGDSCFDNVNFVCNQIAQVEQ